MDGLERPRFLLDGMLVRLGKYLRCAGYDAAWDRDLCTRALALRARAEDRILVTRNTRMKLEIPPPPRWVLLREDDPVEQLRELARAVPLDLGARLFTRCIRCNLELLDARSEEVLERVLPEVRAHHQRFFTCPRCRTIFWHGSHVENTCRKLGIDPPAS